MYLRINVFITVSVISLAAKRHNRLTGAELRCVIVARQNNSRNVTAGAGSYKAITASCDA